MKNLEMLKEIITSKPIGAQSVMMTCNPIYLKIESDRWYAACKGQDWIQITDKQVGLMRSIDDIEKIIELSDDNKSLICELEQGGQSLESLIK